MSEDEDTSRLDLSKVAADLRKARPAKKGSNVITPLCRVTFPVLFTPKPPMKNSKPDAKKKYSIALLIPPEFDIKLLKDDADRALKEKFGDKIPKTLKSPFKDAGDFDYKGYLSGWTLIRATTEQKPKVVEGRDMSEITEDQADALAYSGRWCIASVKAFGYDVDGGRGVAFGLNNVMMLDHDERLAGGRTAAENEFDTVGDYAAAKDADSFF